MTSIETDFITRARLIGVEETMDTLKRVLIGLNRRKGLGDDWTPPVRLYVARITNMIREEPHLFAMIQPQFEALCEEQPEWRDQLELCRWAAGLK